LTLLKGIVVCLVLANVGYFLWARGIATTAEPTAQPAPTPTLRLKSESVDAIPSAAVAAPPGLATGSGPTAEITGADAAASAKPGLLTSVKRCISVGPFRDVSEAAHAATTLRGAGYDPRQRVADGEVWAGVWVYLPLPASRSNSEQLLVKLRAGGIDDALSFRSACTARRSAPRPELPRRRRWGSIRGSPTANAPAMCIG